MSRLEFLDDERFLAVSGNEVSLYFFLVFMFQSFVYFYNFYSFRICFAISRKVGIALFNKAGISRSPPFPWVLLLLINCANKQVFTNSF